MRQTDYDKEKALEKLKQHNMVALDVVKEYMGIPLKRERKKVSTNQAVFREFRTFLDEACSNYNKKKTWNKRNNFTYKNLLLHKRENNLKRKIIKIRHYKRRLIVFN